MKSTLLLCLSLLGMTSLALAEKSAGFPKAEPVISIAVPEGWEVEYKDDNLYVSTEDEGVIVEVSALEATKKEGAKALEEMKKSVQDAFKNVVFKPMQEGGSNNVGLYIINATGEDDEGKANLNAIMVTNGDNDQLFMVFIASSPEGSQKYGEGIAAILASIKKV